MSELIIRDQSLYFHGYDLTGRTNAITLDYKSELQDNTTLGMSTRSRIGGMKDVSLTQEGFMNCDDTDAAQFAATGLNHPISIGLNGDDVGDLAALFRSAVATYQPGAQVGEIMGFSFEAQGGYGDPLVKGQFLLNSKLVALTATGDGTAVELGAIGADQKLFAAMHVLNAGTGTLDMILESDVDGDFNSPTTQVTFSQASAIGSQWGTKAGAVTDEFWRASWTIAGGAPSFKVIVTAGIITI